MLKRYLLKVSWQDEDQPLLRHNDNIIMDLDFSTISSHYELRYKVEKEIWGSRNPSTTTIDFMMEIPDA